MANSQTFLPIKKLVHASSLWIHFAVHYWNHQMSRKVKGGYIMSHMISNIMFLSPNIILGIDDHGKQ
jgi:hypothetical protein